MKGVLRASKREGTERWGETEGAIGRRIRGEIGGSNTC